MIVSLDKKQNVLQIQSVVTHYEKSTDYIEIKHMYQFLSLYKCLNNYRKSCGVYDCYYMPYKGEAKNIYDSLKSKTHKRNK